MTSVYHYRIHHLHLFICYLYRNHLNIHHSQLYLYLFIYYLINHSLITSDQHLLRTNLTPLTTHIQTHISRLVISVHHCIFQSLSPLTFFHSLFFRILSPVGSRRRCLHSEYSILSSILLHLSDFQLRKEGMIDSAYLRL